MTHGLVPPKSLAFRLLCVFILSCSLLTISGCSGWFSRSDRNLTEYGARRQEIKKQLVSEDRPTIIRQIASPAQLTLLRLENVAMVSQLQGTGGKVDASSQREKMLDMMRLSYDAQTPNAILDDPSTALVIPTAAVAPAAQKGARLDISVALSSHAEATDMTGGWLMETGLVQMSLLGGRVREGFDMARAEGHLVTQAQVTGDDSPEAKLRAIVVGGGQLLKSRNLGLNVTSEFADAVTMKAIVPVINRRFTLFDGHSETGVATPRDDNFVEIQISPRYRHDPYHYVNVIMQLGFNETPEQKSDRMALLQRQLQEPTTVRTACWELEAIGEQSIPLLTAALDNPNPEIRFYAAHSLAYLEEKRPIPELAELCLQEPAFRAMCLNALAIIDSFEAEEALRELLHAADPEVKYGAVLALRKRDESDPEVRPVAIGEAGYLLEIPSSGPPLVAVSLNQVPEVVIFGADPTVHISEFHYVNSRILITNAAGGLSVSKFGAGDEQDVVVEAQPTLTSLLRAITEAGGTYGDWVQFIREAHEKGLFIEPMEINPIPYSGRTYDREQQKLFEVSDFSE